MKTPGEYYDRVAEDVQQLAAEAGVPAELLDGVPGSSAAGITKPIPPRTPEWVADPVKWASLSRADRRALERHHKRQGKR